MEVNREYAKMQQSCCLSSQPEVIARRSDASALAKPASRVWEYALLGPDSDLSRPRLDQAGLAQDPSESTFSPMLACVPLGSMRPFLLADVLGLFVAALSDPLLRKAASSQSWLPIEAAGSAP